MDKIEIYKSLDGKTEVLVNFKQDSVWLTQEQIAVVFRTQRPAITKHLKNIFTSGELEEGMVSSILEHTTKHGAMPGRTQISKVKYYNLDAIISIGYRVNSVRATQFRQWATQQLTDYLVKGYAVNQKRLKQLQQTIQLISEAGQAKSLQLQEAKGLLEIINNYTNSFVLLNGFDANNLVVEKLNENITYEIQYNEAKAAIAELKKQLVKKKEATELFGKEKDNGFKSSLQNIVQTFNGQYLYPSIEQQAANLLYFIIKNHSFVDGNKRIGAFLFIWFLEKNKHRFKKSGELKINDNALTALALLVAQSDSTEKEIMIKLIINLINDK